MNRPSKLTASRIIGLDLSKKTLVGCSLSIEDSFQKKKHFNGLMNAQGRTRLAAMVGKGGDAVFMEGGSSSFTLARYLLSNTEADVFVLNPPMQLHIIFESMCKTDKSDAAKLAKYARDTHPENWCLIPIPTEQESAERSVINLHIAYSQYHTKVVNKLHAVFNGQGYPDLKKSDLKNPQYRRDYAEILLDNETSHFTAVLLTDLLDSLELQIEAIHERIHRICYPIHDWHWHGSPSRESVTSLQRPSLPTWGGMDNVFLRLPSCGITSGSYPERTSQGLWTSNLELQNSAVCPSEGISCRELGGVSRSFQGIVH